MEESADIELRSAVPMEVLGAVDRRGGGVAAAGPDGVTPGPARAHVTGSVVYVDDASAVSIATRDVAGKIAVMVTRPVPASFYDPPHEKIQALLAAGATGVLAIYDLPGNLEHVGGFCPPGVPGFYLGGRDGAFLLAVIEKAAARGCLDTVRVEASVRFEDPRALTAQGLVGWVRGTDSGDAIIVSAHSDAFFTGANDNATGVAALIGLARHYAAQPVRDFCFPESRASPRDRRHGQPERGLSPPARRGDARREHRARIAQAEVYRSYVSRHDDGFGKLVPDWVPTGCGFSSQEMTVTRKSYHLSWTSSAPRRWRPWSPAASLVSEMAMGEPVQLAARGVIGCQGGEARPG